MAEGRSPDVPVEIASLRAKPQFRRVAADRIWNAWWRDAGFTLGEIDARVRESLGPETLPTTLVAVSDGRFLGTVSLIESDMEARPAYRPWVAALWVDPEHRRLGIGARLVEAVAATAFEAGFGIVYLGATPANAGFYRSRGWHAIEDGVDGLDILALAQLNRVTPRPARPR